MAYEIGVIAHSCGVDEPRKLKRQHCRIVTEMGKSVPLNEIYPYVQETTPMQARRGDSAARA